MMLRGLVYILQSENYSLRRFVVFAYTHGRWWKLENRQSIVWTTKARALWVLSLVLFLSCAAAAFAAFGWGGLFAVPVLILGLPLFVAVSFGLLFPLDTFLKQRKVSAAKKILAQSPARIIGITGSYGKTTTKEILAAILKQRFSVMKTPENVNTDIGIADFIMSNAALFQKAEIFIVEMGAHRRGEIARISQMVRPEYSILTGINEAHLERFGNLDEIVLTKFELPEHTQKLTLLNLDDENIRKNYRRFSLPEYRGVSEADAAHVVAKENFQGLRFEWRSCLFETHLLAPHNITLILLSATLAEELSVPLEKIQAGVKDIRPVSHRLEPLYNPVTDIMVIDDSYNGNLAGIKSGIEVLKEAKGRKVVLTPGLVELGDESERIHREIGELYGENVDLVLLIQSKATRFIIEGLKKHASARYKVYTTTEEAHKDLQNVLRKGDTIIFQNDLTDNYF